jgi:excisionase family DNA binding protein
MSEVFPPQGHIPAVPQGLLDARTLARTATGNLLLVGPSGRIDCVLDEMRPELPDPILVADGPQFTPAMAGRARTVILRDVDAMPINKQREFLYWLSSAPRTRIVSTASPDLFAQVGATFMTALYHKLKLVYVEPDAIAMARTVSIDKAAQLLDVSRRTIYNRIRDGTLKTTRTLGGSQRVTLESLADVQRRALLQHLRLEH